MGLRGRGWGFGQFVGRVGDDDADADADGCRDGASLAPLTDLLPSLPDLDRMWVGVRGFGVGFRGCGLCT